MTESLLYMYVISLQEVLGKYTPVFPFHFLPNIISLTHSTWSPLALVGQIGWDFICLCLVYITHVHTHTHTHTQPEQNGAIPHDATPATVTSSSSPPSSLTTPHKYVLPEGWTEHKTNEGHTYYYNATTGEWNPSIQTPGIRTPSIQNARNPPMFKSGPPQFRMQGTPLCSN